MHMEGFLKDSWCIFVSYFAHHTNVLKNIGVKDGYHLQ